MPAAVLPSDEAARLAALRAFAVLDTPPEPDYDDLTRLAATVCGTPVAVVSLVDADRQWFKSRVGLDACETHRDVAFCAHALLTPDLLEVADATADPRFADNPLVTGEPGIRFYAGMPLATPDGHTLGTLCVIDFAPRTLTAAQRDGLRVLARQVVAHLLLRKRAADLREREDRFRAFMDNSPAVAFMKDEAGRYVYVNRPACRRFGLPAERWLGRTDAELWAPEVAGPLMATDLRVLTGDETVTLYETVPTPDGQSDYWESFKFPFTEAAGRRYLAGMAVDRTARKRVEDALRAGEAKFRNIIDRLAEGLFVVDPAADRFVEANAAVLAMLGYTADEFLALRTFDILNWGDRPAFDRTIAGVRDRLAADGRCDMGRQRLRRTDGAVVVVEMKVTVVPNGGAGLHAVIVRDVSEELRHEELLLGYQVELEAANAKLRAQATTDRLTGVNNRAAFDERLAEAHERSRRSGRPLSLALLDVDHFKQFNDVFGHPAGDAVLQAVAKRLTDTVRATDVVARYGGEEFAVLLPDTDYAGAMVLAERCRRAVAAAGWDHRPVTVSVGVATLGAGDSPGELVTAADQALYQSKRAGRNRVSHGSGTFAALVRS